MLDIAFPKLVDAMRGQAMRRKMTADQIPAFVQEVLATGCPIRAVGDDVYAIADAHLPDEVYERLSRNWSVSLRSTGGASGCGSWHTSIPSARPILPSAFISC